MTNEDKKIVADYMNWPEDEILIGYCTAPDKMAHFDLNDAGLVVEEMVKRGEWEHDFMDFVAGSKKWNYHQCIICVNLEYNLLSSRKERLCLVTSFFILCLFDFIDL
jgi:hypothetical protein